VRRRDFQACELSPQGRIRKSLATKQGSPHEMAKFMEEPNSSAAFLSAISWSWRVLHRALISERPPLINAESARRDSCPRPRPVGGYSRDTRL
jgi:hypothetical protein